MKIFFLLLHLLLFTVANFAQNFFPMKVGNIYQVKNDWFWTGPGGTGESGTNFKTISFINDSVINGETFYGISITENGGPFLPEYLFSYDSLNNKLLVKIPGDDTIRLAADFNTSEDSAYISYFRGEPIEFISGGISSEVLLGDTLMVYKMESPWEITGSLIDYNFAEDVGFSYYKLSEWGPSLSSSSEYQTIGAIIDTSIFNPLILQIDSLYPVIDRPINSFPFLLSIPFHVSYNQLIDNFQLTLEVEQDSEIVFSTNYNISKSNPHIQINPSNLQIGDVIKLKATITDTSIFNNVDVYPDSGWVTFRILDPVSIRDKNPSNLIYKLEQNYPNPFNPTTKIKYQLPELSIVKLTIYDVLGREVTTLVNEEKPAGDYEVEFNGSNLSSGVYIYQLRTPDFVQTRKLILTK